MRFLIQFKCSTVNTGRPAFPGQLVSRYHGLPCPVTTACFVVVASQQDKQYKADPCISNANYIPLACVGSTRPRIGSARPRTGSARPPFGSAKPRVGSTRPRTGSARPRTGSARPPFGSAKPRVGSARPLVMLLSDCLKCQVRIN